MQCRSMILYAYIETKIQLLIMVVKNLNHKKLVMKIINYQFKSFILFRYVKLNKLYNRINI